MCHPKDGSPGDYLAEKLPPKPITAAEGFGFGVITAIVIAAGITFAWFNKPSFGHDAPRAVNLPDRDGCCLNAVLQVDQVVFIHAWDEDKKYCPRQYVVAGEYCREFIHPCDPKGYIKAGDLVYSERWKPSYKYPLLADAIRIQEQVKLDAKVVESK